MADASLKTEGGTLGRLAPPGATPVGSYSGKCEAHTPICFAMVVVKIFGNAFGQSSLSGSDWNLKTDIFFQSLSEA